MFDKNIHDKKFWLLVATVLLIALGLRVSAIISDSFDYDTYSLMTGVEKEYKEYILSSFNLAQKTHYWLSYRLFGDSLLAYRVAPAALQFMSILALLAGAIKLWHKEPYMPALSLLFMAYNSQSLYTTSYAMVTYANDVFLGAVLFLFFLRISSREIIAKEVQLFSLFVFPFVVFSSVTIVVPLFAGVFSVLMWRTYSLWNNRLSMSTLKDFYRLWPLLSVPTTLALIWWMFPFTNLGQDKRPDMQWLFFGQSGFYADNYGLIRYWLYNTGTLIRGIIKPEFTQLAFSGRDILFQYIAYAIFVGFMVFSALYLLVRKRLDVRIKFTLAFLVVVYSAILVGGILGMYPFGDVRYAGWLVVPAVILIGYIFSKWFSYLERLVKAKLFWGLFVIVAASGALFNAYYLKGKIAEKKANYYAVEFIMHSKSERMLISSYNQPVLSIRAPVAFSKSLDMGWGTIFGHGSDGGMAGSSFELFSDAIGKGEGNTVTVVALSKSLFSQLYPTWSGFINKKYELVREVNAPAMWAGEFKLATENRTHAK